MKSSKSTIVAKPKAKVVTKSKQKAENKVILTGDKRIVTSEGWLRHRRAEVNKARGIG